MDRCMFRLGLLLFVCFVCVCVVVVLLDMFVLGLFLAFVACLLSVKFSSIVYI